MAKRIGIEVSLAIGEALKLVKVDVVSAYPITPQTHIVEGIADLVANGELDAESITVESEHSALSACLGAAAAGARTFTATAGQGLELMHEVVFVASSMRLPIVMTVANRALSAPLSVWGDHSDVMAVRDSGWIQIFCVNGQEVLDHTIWAFRVAEDKDVLFPVMINLDGFHLTHVVEPLEMPEQSQVDKFLPSNKYPYTLDPKKPLIHGSFATPQYYTEIKKSQTLAFENSMETILKAWDEFEKIFGRKYKPVESYKTDGAETLMLIMGSYAQTAELAIDELQKAGEKVGMITLRLWRPFPFEELKKAVKGVKNLIVLDRSISTGGPGGPVFGEIRAALYDLPDRPRIVGFIAGLGGRDMRPEHFREMYEKGIKLAGEGFKEASNVMLGVRE